MQRLIYLDLSSYDEDSKKELGELVTAAGGVPKFAENSIAVEDNDKARLEVLSILHDFNIDHREVIGPDETPSNEAINAFADKLLNADTYNPQWLRESL